LEQEHRRGRCADIVPDAGRHDEQAAGAEVPRFASHGHVQLTFDYLNRDHTCGGVFGETRAGVKDEQSDGSSGLLEKGHLPMAVPRGGGFGTQSGYIGVQINHQAVGCETF